MEKKQTEFADSQMLKFSTFEGGLWQWYFLKVSEPEVHRCGEFVAEYGPGRIYGNSGVLKTETNAR